MTPKRRLTDLIVDLIALVKGPATGLRFAVIKSHKGGDEIVDKLYQLIQEICSDDSLEQMEKSAIPKEAVEAATGALTVLKSVMGDLPADAQTAIKLLVKTAGYGHVPAKKSAAPVTEDKNEFVGMLEEMQTQLTDANGKFAAALGEVEKSKEVMLAVQKSIQTFGDRLKTVETATGETRSKAADAVRKPVEKEKEVEPDIWASTIPGRVML